MKYPVLALSFIVACTLTFLGCDALSPDGGDAVVVAGSDTHSQASAAPVRLTFEKLAEDPLNPGVWHGEVAGAFEGDLETVLLDLRVAGPIWHVLFDWIITDTADEAFDLTARLSGTLNTNTGRVVMNGHVTEGYLQGARVHEEGQLVDPETLAFHGIINIMPRTAR